MKKLVYLIIIIILSNTLYSQSITDYKFYPYKYTYAEISIFRGTGWPINLRASFNFNEIILLDKTNESTFISSVYKNSNYTYFPLIYDVYFKVFGRCDEVSKAAYECINDIYYKGNIYNTFCSFKLESGEDIYIRFYDIYGLFIKIKASKDLNAYSSNDNFEYWKINDIKDIIVPLHVINISRTTAIFW